MDLAMEAINAGYVPVKLGAELIDNIRDLGFQWASANAHGHAMTICAGVMAGEPFDPEATTEDDLKRLESAGSHAMFQAVPLPIYSGLVMHYMPEPEDEEEDEDD